MRHWISRFLVAAAMVGGASLALAFSDGPRTSRTGAPAIGPIAAETTCRSCHGDFAINTGGSVEILGAPSLYSTGRTYDIRVRVNSAQTTGSPSRVWGFELTAVRMSDGQGTGTFADVAGQGTVIQNGTGSYSTRQYIGQAAAGLKTGAASPVEWLVRWTAPASGPGAITFYAVGMAADGDGNTGGDYVYSTSFAAQDTTTPTLPMSWGKVKDRYRAR